MKNDYELLENIDSLYENKNFIYGAGHDGYIFLKILKSSGIQIEAVVDKNKRGESLCGYKIINIEDLCEVCSDEETHINIIIASSRYFTDIINDIEIKGVKGNIYSYFAVKKAIESHLNDKRIASDFKDEWQIRKELSSRDRLRTAYEVCIRKIIESNPEILIYQVGKVGSSSVLAALNHYNVDCLHTHCLYPENIMFEDLKYDYHLCGKLLTKHPLKIITLIREPIARNISAFFEYAKYPDGMNFENQVISSLDQLSLENRPFSWFRLEFERFTGIDIYKYNFNRDQGFVLIKEKNIEVLCIQMEKMQQNENVIGEFLSLSNFHLSKASNIGVNKISGDVYKEICNNIKIPKKIIDRYYKENKEMDFFYSERDKDQFLKKIKIC